MCVQQQSRHIHTKLLRQQGRTGEDGQVQSHTYKVYCSKEELEKMATVQLHIKLLLQQGRTAEDGHSPATHQTLTAVSVHVCARACERACVCVRTCVCACVVRACVPAGSLQGRTAEGRTGEDGHSPATHQTLRQRGGTVEDSYIYLSRRLDRSGDREDQPTNQPTNQATDQKHTETAPATDNRDLQSH